MGIGIKEIKDLKQQGSTLADAYAALVEQGRITPDASQLALLQKLITLKLVLRKAEQGTSPAARLKKLLGRKKPLRGLYIYGGVGRGKSMLMDLFCDNLNIRRKRRVHFHVFMLEVHQRIHNWRQTHSGDPIPAVAEDIAKQAWVLCFDEMQVSDIGDAMILGRLFEQLFARGVVVVATSNRHPDELYKDGLQRDRFLPFIAQFKQRLEVVELSGETDYRLVHLRGLKTTYFTPLGKPAQKFLSETFKELAHGEVGYQDTIEVDGRSIALFCSYGDIAWVTFSELCEKARGAVDYEALAQSYNTVLLEGIPAMDKAQRNEAKRFVTLIDTLYEHKIKLICTAAATPDKLYKKGDGAFEFERTASRLIEMQSADYLKTPQRRK